MEEEEKKHEGFPLQDSRVLGCDVTTVFVLLFFFMGKKMVRWKFKRGKFGLISMPMIRQ